MPKILVTGGTGLLGGRLIPKLVENGDQVFALARSASSQASQRAHQSEHADRQSQHDDSGEQVEHEGRGQKDQKRQRRVDQTEEASEALYRLACLVGHDLLQPSLTFAGATAFVSYCAYTAPSDADAGVDAGADAGAAAQTLIMKAFSGATWTPSLVATGVKLTTSELTGGDGVIENGQYWATEYGVLP